jgi:hypothetical protein
MFSFINHILLSLLNVIIISLQYFINQKECLLLSTCLYILIKNQGIRLILSSIILISSLFTVGKSDQEIHKSQCQYLDQNFERLFGLPRKKEHSESVPLEEIKNLESQIYDCIQSYPGIIIKKVTMNVKEEMKYYDKDQNPYKLKKFQWNVIKLFNTNEGCVCIARCLNHYEVTLINRRLRINLEDKTLILCNITLHNFIKKGMNRDDHTIRRIKNYLGMELEDLELINNDKVKEYVVINGI